MGNGGGSVGIITQKKSDVIGIMMSHLRSFDRVCDDAEIKNQIDDTLQRMEKIMEKYKKIEEREELAQKEYEKHVENSKPKDEGYGDV